jgi:uncharacterized protein
MIFKFIILAALIYGVYILFFREGNLMDKMKEKSKTASRKGKNEDVETVVECHKCGVYISVDEAILKDGYYYCSKECAEIK